MFTAYSSSVDRPNRPAYVAVEIRDGLYPSAFTADRYALALTLVAAVFRYSVDAAFAAVLLIPTTVVAGFIGTRGSVLASTFMRRYRIALPILNVVLWTWVLALVGVASEVP